MIKLPVDFENRMKLLLGEEFETFLETYEEPRRHGLRVNTLKLSAKEWEDLSPFEETSVPWIPVGYLYDRGAFEPQEAERAVPAEADDEPEVKTLPSRHPYYYAGLYYLQEPSAMTPASVLPVEPGDYVLDLCAAPGGKATALAAKLQGKGLLVANDISASRAKALLKNLEVFGAKNIYVTNAIPARLEEQFGVYFDKILVDAPCSGEGMFRKDLANARAWSLEKVRECSVIQKDITVRAAHMLRPGGMMVYSTCTFSPEENEQVIAHLLRECPEMELMEIPWYEGFSHGRAELAREDWMEADRKKEMDGENELLSRCVRIFPHKMGGEGHFLALLHKKEEGESDSEQKKKVSGGSASCKAPSKAEWKILDDFFADVTMEYRREQIEARKGQIYFIPEMPRQVQGIPFLRNGVYLGEIKKDRFEPSQSFAMALTRAEYASAVDFYREDDRVIRYLRGETVDLDAEVNSEIGKETEEKPAMKIYPLHDKPKRNKGWQLVCVDGYPLGWGKLVNGTLKNKYHSGWRMTT